MIDFATLKGLTIPVLPNGYTKLEYIESTGTQYIDTGYSAPNGFIVNTDFTFTSVNTSFGYIVGSHNLNEPYGRNGVGNNGAFYWGIGTGDTYPAATIQPVTGTRYAIQASTVKGNSYLRVDGTEFAATTDATVRSSENLLIFTNQYQEAFGSGTTKGKLYSLRIYSSDNVLVRDFTPCKNASGVVGLYDSVNKKFYGNAGSGAFVAGAEVGTSNGLCAVTQIKDANGRVLWSAAKPEVTITVTGAGSSDCVRIYHVENNWESYYEPTTFTAKIGDTISCELIECWYYQYLYINDEMVEGGHGENDICYEYTVVSDAVIDLYQYDGSTKREREGIITITEIPEGHALMTVEGFPEWASSFGSFYISYTEADGTYTNVSTDGSYSVPIGGAIEFNVKPNKGYSGYIYVNDNLVASNTDDSIDYSYTLTGNITVVCQPNPTSGNIYITEE